jgi:hypothetical protein
MADRLALRIKDTGLESYVNACAHRLASGCSGQRVLRDAGVRFKRCARGGEDFQLMVNKLLVETARIGLA